MPNITVDVESTHQTVTRHVAMGVVYDVAHSLGFPYNIKVMYPGSSDGEDLPVAIADDGRDVLYDPATKVLVQVDEQFVENDVATMMLRPNNNHPIFNDSNLGVRLAPVYAQTEMTIEFRFRFPDKNIAERVRSDIRRHASLYRDGLMHEVNYKYLIPKVEMVILSEIYKLREEQAGYGESMREWFDQCFSDRVTVLSNRNASHLSMAMNETQTGILGSYDFDIVPESAEPTTSKTTHTLTFTYKLQYDKILSATMKYPILIHNRPISSKMYDTSVPFELGERLQMPSRRKALLDNWTNNQYVTGFTMGAPIPIFNEWQPPSTLSGVEGLLRIMVMVNPDDRSELLNLTELGQMQIVPELLDYIRSEGDRILSHRDSAINVTIYENDNLLSGDKLTIDGDLNVRTTFEMDLRKHYNVLISIVADLRLLSANAIDRLRDDGDFLNDILLGIEPTLPEPELATSMSGGYVAKDEWKRVVQNLTSKRVPVLGEQRYGNFRIGRFILAVS